MAYRKRLIQATTVLLYMGPLLAGLAGFGPGYLMPFVTLFMLWLVMLRPHKWPQSFGEWLTPTALIAGVTLLTSQILFVAVLFGIGRGIGGVLGFVPLFNPLLPLALSFVAVPLLRMAWVPELALANGETIDQLLWTDDPGADAPRQIPASAEGAVSGLFALSEDAGTDTEVMLDRLDHFLDTGDIWSRLAALTAALDACPSSDHLSLRTAVILKATDPFPQSEYTVPGEMRTAFAAAGNSADLLSLLSLRGRALLQKIPATAHYFPPVGVVLELAEACGDTTAALALRDLAAGLVASGAEQTPEPVRTKPAATRVPGFVPPAASAQGA
ncbi:hypothetical protein [Pseudogemmobacter bohemicus]|uniref:hypothetical protein n=1 Tax=Pseudogemmobacter bohemicus TaxID=2250708 RepID=UPI0013002EED|nr:hypothetical protein [Pseudogemmobacter bohemicus]